MVLIVSFEVPEPFITEAGLNEQVGGAVVVADPINTILLHEKVTPWLNPSVGDFSHKGSSGSLPACYTLLMRIPWFNPAASE